MQIREDLDPLRRRSVAVLAIIMIIFGVLDLRLFYLQIVTGERWRSQAENNRLRRFPLPSPRGRIFDRRGNVLADNIPAWNLWVFPEETNALLETAVFLARNGLGKVNLLREFMANAQPSRAAPRMVAEGLSWEQVTRIRSHQSDYPELSVVSGLKRIYPFGQVTAHVVGHLRLIGAEKLAAQPRLDPNTLVGATGIEATMNQLLSGSGGERWVVVSALGRQLGVLREEQPTTGQDVSVTIDVELQKAAAEALGSHAGAVIALDPGNGAVRVLYSSPSYDPALFVGRLSPESWQKLANDPSHPLQNRAIQGAYPPGSTIKPFFALGALYDGLVSPQWSVYCSGLVTLYNHPFRCWRRGGHGAIDLLHSLEASCDSYYYLLGQKMGIERMAYWLRRFGFGEPTHVGLGSEAAGLIGTPEWSRRVRGTPWYAGEAVSISIGQGPLLVTTIQLARAFAALANGGQLVTPHLVESANITPKRDLSLDADQLNLIKTGLAEVTHGSQGTAPSLRHLPVAGKTGTAQVARLQDDVDNAEVARHLRHHAWFVGWAPLDHPKIVVAVVVEHGGSGGAVAAPAARVIFERALAQYNIPVEGANTTGGPP